MDETTASGTPYVDGQDRGQRITFGVELEFLVAHLSSRQNIDPDPEDTQREVYIQPLPDYLELPRSPYEKAPGRFTLEDGVVRDNGFQTPPSGTGAWIRHRIAKLLRTNGIPAVSDSADEETVQVINSHTKDARERLSLGLDPDIALPYNYAEDLNEASYWNISTDTSVGEPFSKQYDYSPVEIQSPVLYYDESSINLVKFVVNLIVSEFRILTNHSTMLHVHVGRGNNGFSLNDLRMISSVLYAAAPRLDQLHPVHCGPTTEWAPGSRTLTMMANVDEAASHQAWQNKIDPSETDPLLTMQDTANEFALGHGQMQDPCHPNMTLYGHALLQQWPGRQRAAMFGVSRIWRTRSLEELYENVGPIFANPDAYVDICRPAYNLKNLKEQSSYKKTVEFRQHAGTMSPLAIEHWIRVTSGIIDFCIHAPFATTIGRILRRLERPDPNAAESGKLNDLNLLHIVFPDPMAGDIGGMSGEPYSIYDFLWDINLAPQAEFYRSRGLHPLPPDFPAGLLTEQGKILKHKDTPIRLDGKKTLRH